MADSIGEQVRIASDKTAQLESVLNTMSDGVLVLGPQGRIRRCNGAFARLFPQVTDMAGSPVIEVIPSPELQDAVDALLRSAQVARTASGSGDEDRTCPVPCARCSCIWAAGPFRCSFPCPCWPMPAWARCWSSATSAI